MSGVYNYENMIACVFCIVSCLPDIWSTENVNHSLSLSLTHVHMTMDNVYKTTSRKLNLGNFKYAL